MKIINFNKSWHFQDFQNNIEVLVSQFNGLLASFSLYEIKKKNETVRNIKTRLYSCDNIFYWQKDKIWEILNGDIDISQFKKKL